MTREEAIRIIETVFQDEYVYKYYDSITHQALDMAIEALKQVTGKLKKPDDSLLTADPEACKEQKSKLDLISRQAAIDAICKDWCNTTYKDCKTPFNQETDEYYHCDGCGDVEMLLALPSAETPTVSEKHQLSEETPTNTSTNISTDASADRPRPIDPTCAVDLESGVIPRSAAVINDITKKWRTWSHTYDNACMDGERSKHKMKKPAKPDAAREAEPKQEKQGGHCLASRTPPSMMKKIEKDANKAPTCTSEEFRGRLARSIKAAARWMEDNAEGIAGTIDGRSSLGIWLRWECSGQEITPDINIDGDFLCREAIEEMFKHE